MKSSVALLAGSILLMCAAPAGAATETVLYSFCSQPSCADGEYPWAGVLRVGSDLYTTATIGGGTGTNQGTLVAVNRSTGAGRVVYSFEDHYGDAAEPEAGLINANGTLYGLTVGGGLGNGGNGDGTVYSLAPKKGKVKVLYSFCLEQDCPDGALPAGNLLDVGGLLYGATSAGGGKGRGTVFSFDPATNTEEVLYAFCSLNSCADGSGPVGSLIEVNGILYGTTAYGGTNSGCGDTGAGCGTVFALDPKTGVETVLHAFSNGTDGGTPEAGLLNVNGVLYGTTAGGGSCGCGTVFSVDPATGTERIVHSFQDNGKDGWYPTGGLIRMKGKLYGTTRNGGAYAYGTVFSLDPKTGKEDIVYSFCSQERCNDGAAPYAGLIAVHGTLYGTTVAGGTGDPNFAIGGGTVFAITP
jgi:uncharacterized repeat protein (TIGR03803 family)